MRRNPQEQRARAGEATRRYKDEQVDKKDVALRPKLKAMDGAKKKLDVDFGANNNDKCT